MLWPNEKNENEETNENHEDNNEDTDNNLMENDADHGVIIYADDNTPTTLIKKTLIKKMSPSSLKSTPLQKCSI